MDRFCYMFFRPISWFGSRESPCLSKKTTHASAFLWRRRRKVAQVCQKITRKVSYFHASKSQARTKNDLFLKKWRTGSKVRPREIESKKQGCALQREIFDQNLQFEREEKAKSRSHQKEEKEPKAAKQKADREMMLKVLLEAIKI